MAQTLDEFVADETERIKRFAEYWRKGNQENSETFPMKMADGNEGAWTEMLAIFNDEPAQSQER